MKFNYILFGLTVLAIVFSGCKKEEDEISPTDDDHQHQHDGHGEVALNFYNVVDRNDVTFGEQYSVNGVDMVFNRVQYYVHDITFYSDHDGDESLTLDGEYLLVGGDDTHFELGNIELGHIHMMSFKIGVDPVTNSQSEAEFVARPSADPLSAQNPPMHWSWATGSGYRFAALEGTFGADSEEFVYHNATDIMLRETEMMTVHLDLDHDELNEININLNLASVFDGLDMSANSSSHGAHPTNVTIADNLAGAFIVMP